MQAALTGHLVLSTLHTNTAAGAVTRMQDLGIDSFLLASTLRGVLAQRLVRKLCETCREPYTPDQHLRVRLPVCDGGVVYRARGCADCNQTGYVGRLGLYELVTLDEPLQKLVHDGAAEGELERAIRGEVPGILDEGYRLVAEGVTSLEEVLRVTTV